MDLTPFENLIRFRTGICIRAENTDILRARVGEMMAEKGVTNSSMYLDYLLRTPDEFDRLVNHLTVNETYFFRESRHFRIFSGHLIPDIMSRKKGNTVNILSAGCSTGEEPYSIAIALAEQFGTGPGLDRFAVTGADIDTQALASAEEGIFSRHSFREESVTRFRNRYFEKTGENRYRIQDAVRRIVRFQKLNLLESPYPEALHGMDILFYRNVAIYFDPETRRRIFMNLAGILNPGGYLLVSSTETLSHDLDILPLVEMDGIFLYHKKDLTGLPDAVPRTYKAARPPATPVRKKTVRIPEPEAAPVAENPAPPVLKNPKSGDDLDRVMEKVRNREYDGALILLDMLIPSDPSRVRALTLKAAILVNLHRMEPAAELCRKALGTEPLWTEAHLLLGLIAKAGNRPEDAAVHFRKALYIQPTNWLAHFYLARIHQDQGRTEKARRAYRNIIYLLEKGSFQDHGLTLFPLSFSQEQIIHLCRQACEQTDYTEISR